MERDLLTERTLKRKGSLSPNLALTFDPRHSGCLAIQSLREIPWSADEPTVEGPLGCVPIQSYGIMKNKIKQNYDR